MGEKDQVGTLQQLKREDRHVSIRRITLIGSHIRTKSAEESYIDNLATSA